MKTFFAFILLYIASPSLVAQPNWGGSCLDYNDKRNWVDIFEDNPSTCRYRRRKTRTKRRDQLPYVFKFSLEEIRTFGGDQDRDGDGECDPYYYSMFLLKFYQLPNDTTNNLQYIGYEWMRAENTSFTFSETRAIGTYYYYFVMPKPSLLKIDYEFLQDEDDDEKDSFKMRSRFYTACEEVTDFRPARACITP